MTDMMIRDFPSAVYIRGLLNYAPETGEFVWRWRNDVPQWWNTRYAGKVAGKDNGRGYWTITIGHRSHKSHRLAWLVMTGELPSGHIDHINGVRNDNRFANLRDVSRTENNRNVALRIDNISGCVGVCWVKREGQWVAQIAVNRRNIHLGYFDCLEGAIAARKAAEITYGFHPNHGRTARLAD
jgi:hypothetical protein